MIEESLVNATSIVIQCLKEKPNLLTVLGRIFDFSAPFYCGEIEYYLFTTSTNL
jgi:hypothetical protein